MPHVTCIECRRDLLVWPHKPRGIGCGERIKGMDDNAYVRILEAVRRA